MRPKTTLMATLLMLAMGCGEAIERGEDIPLEKLPAGAMDKAVKALPDVKFSSARKAKFNGQDAIEIRGKDKQGKIREVEVSAATGEIIEIE